jgi:hypothetical protein
MRVAARFIVVAAAIAMGTWLVGWWAVPVIALAAGAAGTRPAIVAGACAASWAALLLLNAFASGFGTLGGLLAGIMGMPMPALIVVTLLFPALLGWSAASLGDAARSMAATSRQPS